MSSKPAATKSRPWQIVGTFLSFEEADVERSRYLDMGYTTRDLRDGEKEVKVRFLSSKNRFVLKVRNKQQKTKPKRNKKC